ncbi:MAG TPA: sulfurtransferase [Glaciihabitans sp.]|nr:sulfurtransferase [Glaciihabitans sp.]
MTRDSILISASELNALLGSDPTVRVLDVRWRLDQPDGRAEFAAGHIPSAVYVDLDTELAQHGKPTDGRHPLPTIDAFERSARNWGLNDGDTVVVYDNLNTMSAARLWWMLRAAGVDTVRVLDGALGAWSAAGFELETGEVAATPGSISLTGSFAGQISIDEATVFPQAGVLLDSRAPERYRGESEPVDPRAGHIPGALNAPASANVDADGRFRSPVELRARFEALGVEDDVPVATYCGSGVVAAHNALALTLAGFDPKVFVGSWSQWSNDPNRPAEVGPGTGASA